MVYKIIVLLFACASSAYFQIGGTIMENDISCIPLIYIGYFALTYRWYASVNSFHYIRYKWKWEIIKSTFGKQFVFIMAYMALITCVFTFVTIFNGFSVSPLIVMKFYAFSVINLLILSIVLVSSNLIYGTVISNTIYFFIIGITYCVILLYPKFAVSFLIFPYSEPWLGRDIISYIIGVGFMFFLMIKALKSDIKI